MSRDQGAVDEDVRIAPYRRGEVAVALQRKPEMTLVFGAVDRFGLTAQYQTVHQVHMSAFGGLP